jgi:hypothetical protein
MHQLATHVPLFSLMHLITGYCMQSCMDSMAQLSSQTYKLKLAGTWSVWTMV